MELIDKILKEVDEIVAKFTDDVDDQNDLRQDVLLKYLENPDKVEDKNIKAWIYFVCRSLMVDSQRRTKLTHKYTQNQTPNVSLNRRYISTEPTVTDDKIPGNIKKFEDIMTKLTPTERMWINQYIESGFNVLEFSRRTNISMNKIKERIRFIFDKWKQLDIYLPR
ncbi:MAG: sigma-70 family RNA polymerase sigma factor [Bacteroidia bacterium]